MIELSPQKYHSDCLVIIVDKLINFTEWELPKKKYDIGNDIT